MKRNLALGLLVCCTAVEFSHKIQDVNRDIERIPENRLEKCSPSFDDQLYERFANVKFDKTLINEIREVVQGCASHTAGKRMKYIQEDLILKRGAPSAEACHLHCFTFPECVAFNWNKWKDCRLLKNIGELKKGDVSIVTGLRDDCTDNISNEAKNYFSNPFLRQDVVKDSFLEAKESWDGSVESRIKYSRISKCLKPLIEFGAISEEELGIAPSLKDGNEVPFLPLDEAKPTSITVDITGTSGPQKIPGINQITYRNWVFLSLYAPPGKIISVVTPEMALSKFQIRIGAHTDRNYNKDEMLRDPDISLDFNITKGTQEIGSPYGGLIIIIFSDNSLDGQAFKMEFENVLKAPHFVLGKDTNEEWNNHIKSEEVPWTVFEIPKKISFVVPSGGPAGAYQLEDVTFNLNEWSSYMDKNDEAAGIVNRPVGEVYVLDRQIIIGTAHNGYPVMKEAVGMSAMQQIFYGLPGTKSINDVYLKIGLGHEVGHNMQRGAYMMSHIMCNIIFNYALTETRKHSGKSGIWGRESRIFSYLKAGTPVNLFALGSEYIDSDEDSHGNDEDDAGKNYPIWSELIKLPFGGLDGSGWENEGSWDDLPALFAPYRELPPPGVTYTQIEKMDLWVKNYCNVKEMNMVSYFDFWKFPITDDTRAVCHEYSAEPTEMMAWISNMKSKANQANLCSGDGWFGNSKKCFKISEERTNFQKARKYCEGLDGSTALASITSKDEANLLNFAYFQLNRQCWIGDLANPSEVFPYASDFTSQPDKKVILGKNENTCHYKQTLDAMEGKTLNCVGPANEDPKKRYFALCEKPL